MPLVFVLEIKEDAHGNDISVYTYSRIPEGRRHISTAPQPQWCMFDHLFCRSGRGATEVSGIHQFSLASKRSSHFDFVCFLKGDALWNWGSLQPCPLPLEVRDSTCGVSTVWWFFFSFNSKMLVSKTLLDLIGTIKKNPIILLTFFSWSGSHTCWGQPFRLCHMTTGRYMGLTEQKGLHLVERDKADVRTTSFCFRSSKVRLLGEKHKAFTRML